MNKNKKLIKKNKILSKKKKIALFATAAGLGILSVTTVTSCASAGTLANNSASSTSTNSATNINTNQGKDGFAKWANGSISIQDVATDALNSSSANNVYLKDKAYELLYDWFKDSTNSAIQSQYNTIYDSVNSAYNNSVSEYKSSYGSNWESEIQTNLFDPAGGTEQDYFQSQMYSSMLTDFEDDVFGSSSADSVSKNFLSFFYIPSSDLTSSNGEVSLTGDTNYNGWTNSPPSVSSNTNVTTLSFVNNTSNWASHISSSSGGSSTITNWNLGFFPGNLLYSTNSDYDNYYYYCNFDQYLFDQWMINENPFITSNILYQYPDSSSGLDTMYNTSYFSSVGNSEGDPDLNFPYLNSLANSDFAKGFYKDLQPSSNSNPDGYVTQDGFSYNTHINSWQYGATVYSSPSSDSSSSSITSNNVNSISGYNTGGFNFSGLSYLDTSSNQVGYILSNDASLSSSDSSFYSYNSFLPAYASAAINKYESLMYNQNQLNETLSSLESSNGIGSDLINVFPSTDISSSHLLSNFLFPGINTSSGTTSFYSNTLNSNSTSSFIVQNASWTPLYYDGQTLNESNFSDYWQTSSTGTSSNWFQNDTSTILTFNPTYGNQITPYVFTRDGDGIHVIAIDGYDRIIEAEDTYNSTTGSSIASPLDVYPTPTNSYEAAVDAVAQDILWRQMQLQISGGTNSGYKIDIFSSLADYFKENFASILLGYAEQLLLNKTNDPNNQYYNPYFGAGYNLFDNTIFGDTDLSNIFNTSNTKEEVATVNLLYWISELQNYLIEQNNENTLKKQIIQTYTGNTSSSSTYGSGSTYYKNGIKPAFPYETSLKNSILYPYLTTYIYHLQFNNTIGLLTLSNTQNTFYLDNNYIGNLFLNSSTSDSSQTYSIWNLDKQLSTIKNNLSSAVNSFYTNLSISASSYSGNYMKYSQYVLTNNQLVNAAIQTLYSDGNLAYLVKNQILSSSLDASSQYISNNNNDINNSNNTNNGYDNVGIQNNSPLNNIFGTSSIDTNYGGGNYLETAIIYEYFLSAFADSNSLSSLYGNTSFQNTSTEESSNYSSGGSLGTYAFNNTTLSSNNMYTGTLPTVTSSILNYYLNANSNYSTSMTDTTSSLDNSYLTLLNTINYLYNGDGNSKEHWEPLINYLETQVENGSTYVVWVGGGSSTNLNNIDLTNNTYTNISSGSKVNFGSTLTNTGQSVQYANQLNSTLNTNYNYLGLNYGVAGYSNTSNDTVAPSKTDPLTDGVVQTIGYSPFNFIPNTNLSGTMVNQYMNSDLGSNSNNSNPNDPSTHMSTNSASNMQYNNISSLYPDISYYYNMANVAVTNSSGTSVEEPFIGFLGLQTSSNDAALSALGLSSYLFRFSSNNYYFNGSGLLSNYSSLGSDPSTDPNQPESTNPYTESTLMSTILNAPNTATLVNISDQLQDLPISVPTFGQTDIGTSTSIQQIDKNYAQNVYNAFNSSGNYNNYFSGFVGYLTNSTTYTPDGYSYFKSLQDFYNVVTGGGYGLQYNNLFSSYSNYEQYLSSSYSLSTDKGSLKGTVLENASTLFPMFNQLGYDRLLESTTNSNDYYMMYVDQITQGDLNSWNPTAPWTSLHLSEDAFAKLLVQIAENSTIQAEATDIFALNNQVTIYDSRLTDALGTIWVANFWITNWII